MTDKLDIPALADAFRLWRDAYEENIRRIVREEIAIEAAVEAETDKMLVEGLAPLLSQKR